MMPSKLLKACPLAALVLFALLPLTAHAQDYPKKLQQAIQKLTDRRYDEAIAEASRLIKEQPPDASQAYALRGEAKFMKQDTRGALKDLNVAVTIAPDFEQALAIRGVVKVRLGELKGALEDCQTAEKLSPNDASNLGNLAFIQYQLHNKDEAVTLIKRALKLDPTNERLVRFKESFEHNQVIETMSVYMK